MTTIAGDTNAGADLGRQMTAITSGLRTGGQAVRELSETRSRDLAQP